MIGGTVYGAALNDAADLARLADAFAASPYRAPPQAPVLYIKPRNCVVPGGGVTMIDDDIDAVRVSAAIALVFGCDTAKVRREEALASVAAAALVLDLAEPYDSYYRPTVRQRCRDGFLPVGALAPFSPAALAGDVITHIDGAEVHRWSLDRLVRDAATLVADISQFMTLAAGDMLILGLADGAPHARRGQHIDAAKAGLPPVSVILAGAL